MDHSNQPFDLFHGVYEVLERLQRLDPNHEYLVYLPDFKQGWKTDEDEEAFREKFAPLPEAILDEAVVEFLGKIEDVIIYDHGAPDWSYHNALLLLHEARTST